MHKIRAAVVVALVLMVLTPLTGFAQNDDPVLDAMSQELARSRSLTLPGYDPPYFVLYSITESRDYIIQTDFGAVINESEHNSRHGLVEVRVGDYTFDNHGKGGFEFDFDNTHYNPSRAQLRVPIEDDLDAIRTQLWLVTDASYKSALYDLLKKRGKAVYAVEKEEKTDSFSHETPQQYFGEVKDWDIDRNKWREFAKELGRMLKDYRGFTTAKVDISFTTQKRRLINTEGTTIVDGGKFFSLSAYAESQAKDGEQLQHFYHVYARDENGIPKQQEIIKEVKQMAEELQALTEAEKIDPYTGPAILDPSLAGVYFHEAIGHRLEGERQNNNDEGQTFKGKIDQAIVSELISLYDDPTMRTYQGTELNGYYRYDSEGVPAQRVVLIENGKLKNFLLSRTPIEGFNKSNGHGRGDGRTDPMARMAITIVEADKAVSMAKLKKMLMEEAKRQGKPYGLILRQGRGGQTATTKFNFQAFSNRPGLIYKVDAETGEETLVRGAEIVGTPLMSLNKVVAAGKKYDVFNGFCGAESGWVPVSVIAPALLVSEIELQRTPDKPEKKPILNAPFEQMK